MHLQVHLWMKLSVIIVPLSVSFLFEITITLEQLDRFIENKGDRFPIHWLDRVAYN
jgi:hypothetical protein